MIGSMLERWFAKRHARSTRSPRHMFRRRLWLELLEDRVALAADRVFKGGHNGGSWDDPENWFNGKPVNGDSVYIGLDFQSKADIANLTLSNLFLASFSGKLIIESDLSVSSKIQQDSGTIDVQLGKRLLTNRYDLSGACALTGDGSVQVLTGRLENRLFM